MKRTLSRTQRLFGGHHSPESSTSPPFFLIAGPCVLESLDHALRTAEHLRKMSERLGIPVIFKASFDKANRQSPQAYRGPGMDAGLNMLQQIKHTFGEGDHGLLVTTDIHETYQASPVAEVADVLQIPALLCRQTDLIAAAANTGRLVNIKKGPFASPRTMRLAAEKVRDIQNIQLEQQQDSAVLLTERGTFLGYDDLVFDPRNLVRMKTDENLIVQDVTHSVQSSSGGADGRSSGGQRELIPTIARAAAAVGVDGLFFETHENPEHAWCDGANRWPLNELEDLVLELMDIAEATRGGRRRRGRRRAEDERHAEGM